MTLTEEKRREEKRREGIWDVCVYSKLNFNFPRLLQKRQTMPGGNIFNSDINI
jgi:hypothetical protein